jgi:hypothetical protein
MLKTQAGGSLLCEGVAVSSFPTKSLVGTHLAKHCGVLTIRDGGNGNSLAHSFIWFPPMNLCSVATGVTVVVFAPKYAEQRELGSTTCHLTSELTLYSPPSTRNNANLVPARHGVISSNAKGKKKKVSDARDLETLLAIARQQEAGRNGSESAQISAIRILANAGGALPIADLISRYGVSSQTIALLRDEEQHTDKRRKVRARLGEVDGIPVAWLTASGHQTSGKSRGFEIRPTSDSLGHALGPSRLANWIEPLTPTLQPHGVELSVTWGPSCQAFSRRTEALAWARLKTQADQTGDVGVLTGGLIPDALLIERRPVNEQGSQMFEFTWKRKPFDRDELAETIVAVEVQNATRQASDPL